MEWLFLLQNIGWIDLVFVAAFLIGVFWGLKEGFGKILSHVFGILVAQAISVEYYQVFSVFVHARVRMPMLLLEVFFFALLAVGSIIFVEFLFQFLALIGSVEFKPFVRNVAGALAGGFYFVLILSLISSFVLFFPMPLIRESFQSRSLTGPFLSQVTPRVHATVERFIPKAWKARS